ncbi:neuropeptide receptor 22 [Lucilia sericata]|uniref:neuropeptide receptor 22 n=1 Tax=Lucilia sericata TaxID=13632 RepID=UPI0018A82E33|nr:neuropeptide receptor 22 [Lucilia sericata]XP_037816182.1 neuropeptide receptor 22 [Lucilia sericata]
MMTMSKAKTKPRKHVNRQQLPLLCWWLIMGTNLLSLCSLTQAINSTVKNNNEVLYTVKPIMKTAATTTSIAVTTINTTDAFDTEIQSATASRQKLLNADVAREIKEIEKQPVAANKDGQQLNTPNNKNSSNINAFNANTMLGHELNEKLILWPNTTIEWLNLTDVLNNNNNEEYIQTKATPDHSVSVSGSASGSLFSTTLSFNHSDRNLFTFHEDCLANSNTLPHIFTIVLYSVVCVVGLFGNTLVIWVVLRFSKMQTVTNIYILNLAIADECFLIGIPFLLYTMRICSWKFGEYMCKAYMVSTSITQFTSSIFLLIMAADRYIAVCHPIESPKYRTLRIAKLVSLLAWFTSAILMLPVILFASTVLQEDGINYSCNIDWPEVYKKHSGTTFILYTFLLGFATPLCFILVFYYLVIRKLHSVQQKHKSKEKKRSHRKVTRLVLTVITVYILCWLPHWISQVSLISAFVGQRELSRFEILLFLLFGCLAYSNSAMNPILYAFLSDNFRKSFTRAFTCMKHHEVEAQLINEHSVFTHKRAGSGSKRKNSKHLTVPGRAAIVQQNSCSFLAPTTVHHSGGGCSAVGGGSSSATSTSTATTATDKSSNISRKPNEHLNGDVVQTVVCAPNNDVGEGINMVVSHDQRSQGFKTELCPLEMQNQTDV